jgi:hypothetical protein
MIGYVTTITRPFVGVIPPLRRKTYTHKHAPVSTKHKYVLPFLPRFYKDNNTHFLKRNIQTHAIPTDIETYSYYIGKGIILFTMFYCTLNWAHYKKLREEDEKNKKKD